MKSLLSLLVTGIGLAGVVGCGATPTTTSAKSNTRSGPDKSAPPMQSRPHPIAVYEQALARAKTEGKLVFVEFSADWCGPCQKMKRETFADPRVQAKLAEYVTLFVDSDQNRLLAELFNVDGIPAYFLVRADRGIVRPGAGYRGPGEFLQWLAGTW